MKTFENKVTEVPFDESRKMTYADLADIALNHPPQGGFTPKDMKDRMRVQIMMKPEEKEVELEDADVSTLKKVVSTSVWARMEKDVIEFCDYVEQL